jgi:hypothetical protein
MVPLSINSLSCILKCLFIESFDVYTFISMIISLSIIAYYIGVFANKFTRWAEDKNTNVHRIVSNFDIDNHNKDESRPINFADIFISFLISISLVLLSEATVFGGIVLAILNSAMFFYVNMKKNKR